MFYWSKQVSRPNNSLCQLGWRQMGREAEALKSSAPSPAVPRPGSVIDQPKQMLPHGEPSFDGVRDTSFLCAANSSSLAMDE
jgi:hypothetical protein